MGLRKLLLGLLLVTPSPAVATTFTTTALSDIAGVSSAVIQGEVTEKKSLLDARGVPWTLYSLTVDAMFAGEFAGSQFTFRIIGGQTAEGRNYALVGAPRISVGDSLVLFYTQADDCQVMGMEFGVFWRRNNTLGETRLVNFLDQAVASFSDRGPVFSGEIVPRKDAPGEAPAALPFADPNTSSATTAGVPDRSLPPAAPAGVALDELKAFSARFVRHPIAVQAAHDLDALPLETRPSGPRPEPAKNDASGGAQ